MKKFILISALAGVVALTSCAGSSNSGNDNRDSSATSGAGAAAADSMSMKTVDTSKTMNNMDTMNADGKLVAELIESMYGGIAVMKQAENKATTPAVKALAKKLDMEHSALTKELETLAAKKSWSYPSSPTQEDKTKETELAQKEGKAYESDWLQTLKTKHETNISKLEQHQTTDPDLKAAAAKGLPKIKELLSEIQNAQKVTN